jgi:hypothetical protein
MPTSISAAPVETSYYSGLFLQQENSSFTSINQYSKLNINYNYQSNINVKSISNKLSHIFSKPFKLTQSLNFEVQKVTNYTSPISNRNNLLDFNSIIVFLNNVNKSELSLSTSLSYVTLNKPLSYELSNKFSFYNVFNVKVNKLSAIVYDNLEKLSHKDKSLNLLPKYAFKKYLANYDKIFLFNFNLNDLFISNLIFSKTTSAPNVLPIVSNDTAVSLKNTFNYKKNNTSLFTLFNSDTAITPTLSTIS